MIYKTYIRQYLEKHGFEALRPKAVLFDMDGVLYDSMPRHAEAWQRSMACYGIEMSEMDAYLTEGARGIDTIRQMVMQQQGREIGEAEAQLMYDKKTELFHAMTEAPVMPGIPELMRQIDACGMQIGVVTGSGQRPLINRLLKDFGQYLTEDHITTAYDVKRGKPAPDPYLTGLRRMGGLMPWQAIVVENAPLGVAAGVAARIFTIAVNTGILPASSLRERGADIVLGDMPALSKVWGQLVDALPVALI